MRLLLSLSFTYSLLSFAEPMRQTIVDLASRGYTPEQIEQILADKALAENEPDLGSGSHGGGQAPSGTSRVGLPVISNMEIARQAIEEEVRKGNLPPEAVGPLLEKLAPMVDRYAERISQADGDPKKMAELMKDPPKFRLEYNRGKDMTQVVAQVVSGVKGTENAPNGSSSLPQTVPPQIQTSNAPAAAYNQPAPTLVIQTPSGGSSPSVYVAPIGKASGSDALWLAKLGDPKGKEQNSRRPTAENPAGMGGKSESPVSQIGKGLGTGSAGGSLPSTSKPTGLRAFIKSVLDGLKKPVAGEASEVANSDPKGPEKALPGLIKPEKLSATAAILRLPQATWEAASGQVHEFSESYPMPEWIRMIGLLVATAFTVLTGWLVWRRRYFPRK